MFRKFTDKDLIDGIRRQDDKALKYVYDSWFPMVKNHVLRNSGDNSDAVDVMQESIISLYRQTVSGELKLTSDLKGYFFGISKMTWITQRRQKKKYYDLAGDIVEESSSGEESKNQILERVVARAVTGMKDDCREVILLFSSGSSYAEIAKKLGLKNEEYARRKKYLCKEALMEIIRKDPEYIDHFM